MAYMLEKLTAAQSVISHLPPDTSKWNKIEQRLFSFISQNWRAQPLVSYRVIIELISATTTKIGLTVRRELDTGQYPSEGTGGMPVGWIIRFPAYVVARIVRRHQQRSYPAGSIENGQKNHH